MQAVKPETIPPYDAQEKVAMAVADNMKAIGRARACNGRGDCMPGFCWDCTSCFREGLCPSSWSNQACFIGSVSDAFGVQQNSWVSGPELTGIPNMEIHSQGAWWETPIEGLESWGFGMSARALWRLASLT